MKGLGLSNGKREEWRSAQILAATEFKERTPDANVMVQLLFIDVTATTQRLSMQLQHSDCGEHSNLNRSTYVCNTKRFPMRKNTWPNGRCVAPFQQQEPLFTRLSQRQSRTTLHVERPLSDEQRSNIVTTENDRTPGSWGAKTEDSQTRSPSFEASPKTELEVP